MSRVAIGGIQIGQPSVRLGPLRIGNVPVALAGSGGALPLPWYLANNNLANSLIGYWQMDEASGNAIDYIGPDNLTDANAVGNTTGLVYDSARLFAPASSQRLYAPSAPYLRIGNHDWWLGAWFNSASLSGTHVIAAEWTNAVRGWTLYTSGTTLTFVLGNGTNTTGTTVTIAGLSTGVNYFVMAWHDLDAQTVNLCLNNGSVASIARGVTPGVSTADFEIGSNGGGSNYFSGAIGPVMLGKYYIPTADDRTYLYNGGAGRILAEPGEARRSYFPQYYNTTAPRPQVMYDFDMDSDIDDVVDAVLMLNLEARGELDIVAAINTADNQWAAPTWLAIANYYGRADIPTGANTDDPGSHASVFTQTIASTYGVPGYTDVSDFPAALTIQRSVLAAAADNSIDYITTGGLSSVKALLESAADGYSALDGVDLVAAKIHSLWIVGGYWPSGTGISDFGGDSARATVSDYVLDNWPTTVPIIFVPIGDGDGVLTGGTVMEALSSDNPARAAWELYFGNSNPANTRPGWAQIGILPLARGLWPNSKTSTNYSLTRGFRGTASVDTTTGATSWTPVTDSNHSYTGKILSDANYAAVINALLLEPA